VKVVVAAHGRFHSFQLAAELHERHHLAALLTTYPSIVARRYLPPGLPLVTVPKLELRRRLHAYLGVGTRPDVPVAREFAAFAARHLPDGANIFVGWSGATLETIAAARQRAMKVVIERGSTHIAHQADVLRQAYSDFGICLDPVDPRMIERELAEYEEADAIAVPSRIALETFIERGVPRNKMILNPYGANLLSRNRQGVRRRGDALRVLFVGGISFRKGIPWLLRAFARVRAPAELHLVGPIEPALRPVLEREPTGRVTFHGPLRGSELAQMYELADVFCLPSLEEGFSLSVLEAMAAELPVIVTPETGATDRVSDRVEGLVVPAKDVERLTDAFETLAANEELRRTMGNSARIRVERDALWRDYGSRAEAAYRQLLAGRHY
jgi:glycosyltransferase involved in cell wall biosynthesis